MVSLVNVPCCFVCKCRNYGTTLKLTKGFCHIAALPCKYQCPEVIASYNRIKHKIANIGQPNRGDLKQFINSIDTKTSTTQENIDSGRENETQDSTLADEMVQSRNQNIPFGVFFNKIINEEIMKNTNFEFNDNENRCYCPELLSYIE